MKKFLTAVAVFLVTLCTPAVAQEPNPHRIDDIDYVPPARQILNRNFVNIFGCLTEADLLNEIVNVKDKPTNSCGTFRILPGMVFITPQSWVYVENSMGNFHWLIATLAIPNSEKPPVWFQITKVEVEGEEDDEKASLTY